MDGEHLHKMLMNQFRRSSYKNRDTESAKMKHNFGGRWKQSSKDLCTSRTEDQWGD